MLGVGPASALITQKAGLLFHADLQVRHKKPPQNRHLRASLRS